MARKSSRASKVRKMLAEGVSPKEIAEKLKMKPQAVYNIRYYENKKQGVASLESVAAVTPRRRGRPPKSYRYPIVVPSQTEKQNAPAQTKPAELPSDVKTWAAVLVAVVVVAIALAITL